MDRPGERKRRIGGAPSHARQMPDEEGGGGEAIPDYLEILAQKKRQEKMEDEMLAAGQLPPHLAAAEGEPMPGRPGRNPPNSPLLTFLLFLPSLLSSLSAAKLERKRHRAKQKNSGVLITGLPPAVDAEELADFVSKFAGVIKKNPETRRRVVKLQHDSETGAFNGSAVVVFFRPESVQQAVTILSGMEYAPGYTIDVKPHKKEKKEGEKGKQKKRDKRVKLYDQEKELDWQEDEDRVHVILKGMFTLDEVREGGIEFFEELREDIETELTKCGTVKSIKIFEYNPEGVVAVKFEKPKGAIRCVDWMNGRFFAGRQLECFYYDGFTNYEVKETEEDRARRIAKFGEWLGAADGAQEDDGNE